MKGKNRHITLTNVNHCFKKKKCEPLGKHFDLCVFKFIGQIFFKALEEGPSSMNNRYSVLIIVKIRQSSG